MKKRLVSGCIKLSLAFLLSYSILFIFLPPAYTMKTLTSNELSQVTGQAGLAMDVDLDASVNALRLIDNNGNNTGNNGYLIFNNIGLGSGDAGDGGIASLSNLTLDADGNEGLVIGAPSNDFSLGVDGLCIDGSNNTNCSNTPYGEAALTDLNLSGTTLTAEGLNEGVSLDLDLNASLSALNLVDGDGYTGGSGNSASLILDDVSLTSASRLSGLTVNADGNDGLVLGAPSGNFTFEVDEICYSDSGLDSNCILGEDFGGASLNSLNLDGTSLAFNGKGDGVNADVDLEASANSIALTDGTGSICSTCSGNGGRLQFGSGSDGITINNGTTGNPATLTGMTVDLDANQGLVVGMPSGTFDVSVDETRLGEDSSSAASLGLGANDLNLDGSSVRVGAN